MKKTTTPLAAKRIAIAVAAVCASLALPAAANENKAMLDLMLKKGVITQKDYNEFMEANKEADENKAFKDSRIDQDVSKSIKDIQKRQNDGSVKENGFGFKSKDGNTELNITGRLHFDARAINDEHGTYTDRDSSSMSDRFSVRRARIGATGIFNKNINYEVVTNLIGGNANLLDTAWANYNFRPEAQVRVGRFKQPYGLETLMSSNNISFMERTYQDQVSPGKQLGAMFHGEQPSSLTYALSAYQTGFDPSASNNNLGREGAVRVTYNLAKMIQGAGDDVLLHVGVAGTSGSFDVLPTTSSQDGSDRTTRALFVGFNDEFGGLRNVYRNRILGTPPCTNTSTFVAPTAAAGSAATVQCAYGGYSLGAADAANVKQQRTGLEFALAKGAAKLQGEYTMADYTATSQAITSSGSRYSTRSTGDVKVYYVEFMYNLTGETWASTYRSGVVGGIRPNSNFNLADGTGTGAWQVGVRYSEYNAASFGDNVSSTGGSTNYPRTGNAQYQVEGSPKGNTITLGVNWILNPNARIMFNYAQSKFDYSFLPVDIGTPVTPAMRGNDSRAFMVRSQFNF
jgi:phosphate-selective porin OprO/OprP